MQINKLLILAPVFLGLLSFAGTALAEDPAVDGTPDQTGGQTTVTYPYENTFTITAYYSPIEGQKRYIRGSLAADKKLNGNGVHGADGTPVFAGMIAAPKTIPFGTKMSIPGIGIVAVHDRGGAIVPAGQRGTRFDRLDVWMGYGDEGLNRALRWGRRTVKVTVYGLDDSVTESIDLGSLSSAALPASTGSGLTFRNDYGFGDQNDEIKEIKQKFSNLGYFQGAIDDKFDEPLYHGVVKFQLDYDIVDNEDQFGAGYFGPQTRVTLEKAMKGEKPPVQETLTIMSVANAADNSDQYAQNVQLAGNGLSFLAKDLQPGDSGQEVVELQTELKKLHLFGLEPTGFYGEVTAHAVFKFQQSRLLVGDLTSPGAGVFGPVTRQELMALVNSRIETRKIIASGPEKRNLLANR
jgi:peptidoglycan hydrolase-like protein with peptidoglycan-binding domain/3D (Asp-Asp-Asp) domain-containing protein